MFKTIRYFFYILTPILFLCYAYENNYGFWFGLIIFILIECSFDFFENEIINKDDKNESN